jgi:hypothetical protein
MIIYASPSDRARIQIDYNNLAGDISTARGIPDKDTSFKKLYLYNPQMSFPAPLSSTAKVIKRDGSREPISGGKIRARLTDLLNTPVKLDGIEEHYALKI